MIQQRELTWFGRCFEDYGVEPKCIREALGKSRLEVSTGGEDTDLGRVFASLDDQVHGTCIEPALSLLDQRIDSRLLERSSVLLSEFELDLESSVVGQLHDFVRFQLDVREAFSTFDPEESHIRAEVEVPLELPLNKVRALLKVALKSLWVVAWVERGRQRRQLRHADGPKIPSY